MLTSTVQTFYGGNIHCTEWITAEISPNYHPLHGKHQLGKFRSMRGKYNHDTFTFDYYIFCLNKSMNHPSQKVLIDSHPLCPTSTSIMPTHYAPPLCPWGVETPPSHMKLGVFSTLWGGVYIHSPATMLPIPRCLPALAVPDVAWLGAKLHRQAPRPPRIDGRSFPSANDRVPDASIAV